MYRSHPNKLCFESLKKKIESKSYQVTLAYIKNVFFRLNVKMILSQQSLPKVKHLQLQKQTHEQLNLLTICFMSTIHILYLSNKSSTKEIPL